MIQQDTTRHTATTALHTIANCIPSMVAPDARVQIRLHLSDAETFDAICAAHGKPEVTRGGGTEMCPHHYRTARIEVNGQEVVLFCGAGLATDWVDIDVHS